MTIIATNNQKTLWQETVKFAQQRSQIYLDGGLETYTADLLMRYANRADLLKTVIATEFLSAFNAEKQMRALAMQSIGDKCLLIAGLFPKQAEKRHVKLSYFVNIGRTAYDDLAAMSNVFSSLSTHFVNIMDVIHTIPDHAVLLPLEAYERWNELDSKHAWNALQSYTHAVPHRVK